MRALFRPFALHAAYTPIETIVFFVIIGTLAYFHILSAIKHSAFLDPAHAVYAAPTLRPSHALYRLGEWVGVGEGKWASAVKGKGKGKALAVEVQQVVVRLEGGKGKNEIPPELLQTLSFTSGPLADAALNLTEHLTSSFPTARGRTYASSLCHRPSLPPSSSASASPDPQPSSTPPKDVQNQVQDAEECFTTHTTTPRALVHTLSFRAGGARDEWVGALLGEHRADSAGAAVLSGPAVFVDTDSGIRFEVDKAKSGAGLGVGGEGAQVSIGQMRNGRWVAYAMKALVLRFWDLAKKADSLDILLILAGYILMHTTFYLLLTRSRALGSSFFLPLAILSSSFLALLLSLPLAMGLKIPIDPVALTEALPFLVCTVGFDKPLRLARAVFMHPHLGVPPGLVKVRTVVEKSGYPVVLSGSALVSSPTSLAPPPTPASTSQLKPAPKIITESLSHVYAPIIRDYVLEIAVLTVGAYSRVGGLREVCALAALILAVDCLLLCTYLAAILGVMVEVRRIKTGRAMTRSRSNSISSTTSSATGTLTPTSAMARPPGPPAPKTLRQRIKSVLLGEKGTALPGYGVYGYGVNGYGKAGAGGRKRTGGMSMKGKEGKEGAKKAVVENPVARLKLLLIASFLTLHILNFITPLTPSKHTHSSATALNNIRRVDITAPGLRPVLKSLVEASAADLAPPASATDDAYADEDSQPQDKDMLVKVSPPIYIRVVLPASMLRAHKPAITASYLPHTRSTSEMVDAFMSAWTRLVGDPIISKWIVVALALSVALNGYLLKGIAAGVVGTRAGGVWAGAFGVKGGVRFEVVGGEESEDEVLHEKERVGAREGEGRALSTRTNSSDTIRKAPEQQERAKTSPISLKREIPKPVEVPVTVAPVVARPQSPAIPPSNIGTFTLEDVDRKLAAAARPASRRLTVTRLAALWQAPRASIGQPTPPFSLSGSGSSSGSSGSEEESESPVDVDVENVRTLEECIDIFENGPRPLSASLALLNDEEVILLAQNGKIAAYALEKVLGMDELERAVRVRRALISRASRTQTLESSDIPLTNYDYSRVLGACCENVVGYIPIPLGIAGPLNVDGQLYPVPMATAEGTLVASTSRGCKALNAGGGVTTVVTNDGMTRGPAIDFPTITMAAHAKMWIDSEDGYMTIKEAFESTSRFAKLKSLKTAMAGRTLFVRFATATGDAMGMNMISKGTEKALEVLQKHYPEMVVLALSGNYCTDKKPAAINWIEGRGKSVVAEAVVPGKVVQSVLKTTVAALCNLNTKKNLIGSAMAGSIGGFNAHAANILTAVFLATGQDPAQNVESSMCMTLMEPINDGADLLMTVSMPCIEVGTVGGGTVLAPQQGVLELLGMRGAHPTHPGQNAQALAKLIAAAVMAGELSLLSALAAGHLIRAHMAHNRSQTNTPAPSIPPTPALSEGPRLAAQLPPAPAKPEGVPAEEGQRRPPVLPLGPLTPSSSTASLPPYSQ
ncbi:unnamed protein product [Cyclocybe aegerita]|uniref:3-hydroxy-3-methylglutaryl coenzyme A reductase n=1 Tax=Cyclocybe aegerita TaxID=1973307 RepID=A0A8S0W363_CYCAE|nr:unnamed protein product [Cyclocybe aegerita]